MDILKFFRRQKQINHGMLYSGGSIPPDFSRQDFLESYASVGWWHAVVFRIALGLSEVKWTLFNTASKDKPKQILDHPLLDFLHLVNPFQTSEEFIALDTIYMECLGESFWVLNFNALGQPAEAILAYPNRMSVVPDRAFPFVKGYVYGNGANAVPLDINQVIHFKYPNPLNQYRGLGQAQSVGINLSAEKNADKWVDQFFYNSARPDGVIQFDYNLSDEQFEKLKKQWSEKYKGVAKAHQVALLEGGGKYIQVQNTVKDMDFPNLKLKNRDIILGVEGMPLSVMGISENVNRANAEAGDYTFARWIVKPRLDWKKAKLQEKLIPKFRNSKNLELGFEEVVPETIEQKRDLAESGMRAGYLTINEARKMQGFDSLPNGDVLLVPLNLIPTPIKEVIKPPTPPPAPASEQPTEEIPETEELGKESYKGGEGSGNFGHEGRPGEVGGSGEGGGGESSSKEGFIKNRVSSAKGTYNETVAEGVKTEIRNSSIPPKHLEYIKSVKCDRDAVDDIGKKQGAALGSVGGAYDQQGNIYMASSKSFTHEVGHAVMQREIFAHARGSEVLNIYGASKKTGRGFVSDYAKKDMREFFAESYAAYAKNPKGFAKKNPPMAKLLKSMW